MLYLWLKALHVVAIIAWMAGMLYLPRLFVYHAETEKGSVRSETFKIMERRLLKAIMNPAMIATWVLGLYLVIERGLVAPGLDARASFRWSSRYPRCTWRTRAGSRTSPPTATPARRGSTGCGTRSRRCS